MVIYGYIVKHPFIWYTLKFSTSVKTAYTFVLVAIFGMLFCAQYSAERVKWWIYVISAIHYKLCIYYNALGFFNWEKQVESNSFLIYLRIRGWIQSPNDYCKLTDLAPFSDFRNEDEKLPRGKKSCSNVRHTFIIEI